MPPVKSREAARSTPAARLGSVTTAFGIRYEDLEYFRPGSPAARTFGRQCGHGSNGRTNPGGAGYSCKSARSGTCRQGGPTGGQRAAKGKGGGGVSRCPGRRVFQPGCRFGGGGFHCTE